MVKEPQLQPETVPAPAQAKTRRPLVEAILELRWNPANNPGSALMAGRFLEKMYTRFPAYEQLNAFLPPDVFNDPDFPNVPQHRFRKTAGSWPIVQVGKSSVSYHEVNQSYPGWKDFSEGAGTVYTALCSCVPAEHQFKPNLISLRYIDAIPFDYATQDVLEFLRTKLSVTIALKPDVMDPDVVHSNAAGLVLQLTLRCTKPDGGITLSFRTGKVKTQNAIIWDSVFASKGKHIPTMPEGFGAWANAAHDAVVEKIFKQRPEHASGVYHQNVIPVPVAKG